MPTKPPNISLRMVIIPDKRTLPAWRDMKNLFSDAGKAAFECAQKEVGQYLAEEALRELRRTLRQHDFDNGRLMSPATNAILMARQKLGAKKAENVDRGHNPKHHYPKTGKLTRAPLLRNEDLLESFKVVRVEKGWGVGIHWAKRTQQGMSMSRTAQCLNDGYEIKVTEQMANFFKALRAAEWKARNASRTPLQKRDESRRKAFFRRHRAILGSYGSGGIPIVKAGDTIKVPARPFLDAAFKRFDDPANPIVEKAAKMFARRLGLKINLRNDPRPSGQFDCEPDDGSAGMESVDS